MSSTAPDSVTLQNYLAIGSLFALVAAATVNCQSPPLAGGGELVAAAERLLLIVGLVRETYSSNAVDARIESFPLEGVTIEADRDVVIDNVAAVTGPDGRFTLWVDNYNTGTFTLFATDPLGRLERHPVGGTASDNPNRYSMAKALFNFQLSRLTLIHTSAQIRFYRVEVSVGEAEIDSESARVGDELLVRVHFDIYPTNSILTINDEQAIPRYIGEQTLQYRFTPRKEGTHIIKGTFFYRKVAVSFRKELVVTPAPRS